jgi:hypothetical protein
MGVCSCKEAVGPGMFVNPKRVQRLRGLESWLSSSSRQCWCALQGKGC